MRVDALTPVIDAAPGEVVVGRVRLVNDGPGDAAYRLRVVGLENGDEPVPIVGGVVSAGLTTDVEVPFQVPPTLGIGHHSVALEISSDRPDERPTLTQLTVAIESIERVEMSTEPSTIRGRRRARFTLDVVNHEPHTVDVGLVGSAPDVRVRLEPDAVQLHPGQRTWVRGIVRGPRRWFGEDRQHVITFSARGRAAATAATSPFVQKPLIPFRLRNVLAMLLVIALWLAAVGGVMWWINERDDKPTETTGQATDADGDGVLDALPDGDQGRTGEEGEQPGGPGQPGGSPDTGDGGAGGGGASGAPTGLARPTTTVVRGTVMAGDSGDSSGVDVRLTPIDLGAQPSEAAAFVGPRPGGHRKLWPARFGARDEGLGLVRRTQSVEPLVTGADGVWLFADVPIRQTYELTFAKPGYNTKSFVVTPADDGSAWELDVELETADGAMAGRVVGPSGPLGGADIVISDGTLTFTTRSATVGDVGTWSVEGISTPGVYTLTASRFGFGTEVLQIRLEPGEQRDGIEIRMRAGVGSISGRIFAEGEPAGGITVTASSADSTYTTSTITEGDIGFYNLPQLPIPGDYTVTVVADGYIPESRQVVLDGAVGGIDFQLVRTTARLTGMVTTSRGGGPLPGAGISVLRDDLGFRSTTAAAPNPGSFSVDDLPPGTYVVRIARYDHLTFSTQVTVGAGEVLDLGTIELTYTARPPLVETGSLTARIFDSTNAELTGATVAILPLDSNTPIDTRSDVDDNQSSFTFEQVDIGTYRVRATRTGYRPATVRVSVGLGPQTVDFRLFKLGQVSGRIVDSTVPDGAPGHVLGPYQLTLSRVVGDTVTFLDTITPENSIEEGWFWESDPTLLPGIYEIAVPVPPTGYTVVPDQTIDPELDPPAPMRFEIPEDAEDPIRLADIEADPYPNVSGYVYVPRLAPGDVVELDRTDVPGISISLTCPASTPGEPPVTIEAEPLTLPGSSTPEIGGFLFTKEEVGDHEAIGNCTLTLAAQGYRTRTVALSPPLAPSNGIELSDRYLSVPMVSAIPQPLTGDLFWRDGSTAIDVVGASISSPSVIVDFAPRQANVPTTAPQPVTRAAGPVTSGGDGTWAFPEPGQVFGASTYTVSSPDFDTATFEVRMSPQRQVVAGANLLVDDTASGPLSIELGSPRPGRIAGMVEIVSTKTTKPFDTIDATGAGPSSATLDIPLPAATTATQTFDEPAAAGSWSVEFDPPTRLVRYDPVAHTVDPQPSYTVGPKLVRPNATTSGFDITLLELGRLDVDVAYTPTSGAPDPGAGTYTLTSPFGAPDLTGTASGAIPFADLAVDLTAPLNPVTYTLDVQRPGYDIDGAAVTVADNTNGTDPAPVSSTGSTGIAVGLAAGSDKAVAIDLEQYGTLAGSVRGETWPGEISDLDFPTVTLDAHRCDSAGNNLGTARVSVRTGTADGLGANDFVVSGPPGLYCIVASHPLYNPSTGPTGDSTLGDTQLPSGQWLFDIDNTEPRTIAPHVLQIKKGTLNLKVVTDKISNSPVQSAEVQLFRQGTTTPIAGGPFVTDVNGLVSVTNLVPGTYDIEIRLVDAAGNDQAFPVIGVITIPSTADDTGRVVNVTAPLPLLQASITGTVIAVNTVGERLGSVDTPYRVAVPATVTVTRTFAPSPLDVVTGGGAPVTVPNLATDADVDLAGPPNPAYTAVTVTAGAGVLESGFSFQSIAGGRHRLTFSDPPGYKADVPPDRDVTVADSGTTTVQVVYVAVDVDLAVTVTGADGGEFENLTFSLTHGTDPTLIAGTLSGNVITFADLPPSTTAYSLTVDDDLHAPQTKPITIIPDTDGVAGQTDSIVLAGDRARITGSVAEQFRPAAGGTATRDGISSGSITLERQTNTNPDTWSAVAGMAIDTDLDPDNPAPNANIDYVVATGEFAFEVTTNGTYRVRAQRDDVNTYTVATSNVVGVTLGQVAPVTPDPLTIVERGRLTVTTTPATATVSVTAAGGTTAPNTGSVYYLQPDITYTLAVTADHYYAAPTEDITLAVGQEDSRSITLDTRTATVNVSGLTSGQNVTVTIAIASATPVTRTLPAGPGGTVTVAFPSGSPFSGHFLPLEGTGTMTVESNGYRTHTFEIEEGDISESPVMRPNVTAITGTVGDDDGTGPNPGIAGVTVVIEGTAFSTTTDAVGAYTFTSSSGFGPGTIVASKLLTGRGTAAAAITADSPTGATLAVADIDLVARRVTVTFTLNTAGRVTFAGQTLPAPASPAATSITFTDAIVETATGTALNFTATAAGHLDQTGSISLSGATGDTSLGVTHPVTMVASPAIGGNVQNSSAVDVNSRARLYTGACPTTGTSAPTGTLLAEEPNASSATFAFSSAEGPRATGSHCLYAVGPGGTPPVGYRAITVNPDASVTSGAATGALVITVTAPT